MRLRVLLIIALSILISSCYTQVRTDVPGIPTNDPRFAAPPPAKPPVKKSEPIQPLAGEYAGYLLNVDDAGNHAMSDVRFWFTPKTYRYQGDNIQPSAGTYTLDNAVLALQDNTASDGDAASVRLLSGRYEVQQAGEWLHLVQRDEDKSYREIGLTPATKNPAPRP